ncbi:hypothetical protein Taro_008064 [Colocasia esculenta]|uniref:Protein CYCLOPS n=1 Tax=Colocasia esculenta TaxID=4460 RepID=A0A843U1C7_COLES|nr:hypothetical protein [Colocasia esculenta]
METEGRGFSDLLRSSTEEMLLRSVMESSMGLTAPGMEMLGLKKVSQALRADSEELFNSWLTNGEIPRYSNTSVTDRTLQATRRLSNELASLLSSQQEIACQRRASNDVLFQQDPCSPDQVLNDLGQHSLRNALEKGMQASNLYFAKAWFQSTQPMTRSRSSELRSAKTEVSLCTLYPYKEFPYEWRMYATMQNVQTPPVMIDQHNVLRQDTYTAREECAITSCLSNTPAGNIHNGLQAVTYPSDYYTPPVSTDPMGTIDEVSSVVSMLKDTLERKKHTSHLGKQIVGSSPFYCYDSKESSASMVCDEGMLNHILEPSGTFIEVPSLEIKNVEDMKAMENPVELDVEDFVASTDQIQLGAISHEPSQSESATAPVISTSFEMCNGPTHSGQISSVSERAANGNSEARSEAKELRERVLDNGLKGNGKRRHLIRVGSLPSGGSEDKTDPTKKRRVERSRKMAEAKERSSFPTVPPDMQSVLKRCENLEKEVRSLKLNLSFMNRKDSEQTKQIEELQKQNEELTEEKERLLEEIERIVSESGNV